jgi:hypothetical protein
MLEVGTDMKLAPTPKRVDRRSRVYLDAHVASDGDLMPVKLRDVSQDGVLVEASSPPVEGSSVQLHYANTVVDARVAWTDKGWYGLRFDHPLTAGLLLDHVSPGLKVSAPRNYRRNMIEDAG